MKNKILLTQYFFALVFSILLGRAFYLQVVIRDNLIKYSETQFIRESTIYPKRGAILDRNGEPLAININTFNVFTISKNIKNKLSFVRKIKSIVPEIQEKELLKELRKRSGFTWILRNSKLAPDQHEKLSLIEHAYIENHTSRFYPNNELLGQLLGFVGIDNKGLGGLEYFFDDFLKGKPQITKYYKDAKGRAVKFSLQQAEQTPEDLVLSIDKSIQAIVETEIRKSFEKHKAKIVGAGVMDARTGEILAMANYPGFDPNQYRQFPPAQRKLPFLLDPFEPGSILKTLTIATALDSGMISRETSYYCEKGKLQIGKHTINEAHPEDKYEWLDVGEILIKSSNIGTTKIAFDLGEKRFIEGLKKFGIGEKTKIEFPAESRGIFKSDEKLKPIELSNMSFGQGIATTGVQILQAYSIIANGGFQVRPTLLRVRGPQVAGERVLSENTVGVLKEILEQVVDEGTGSNAKIPHFQTAGKTGTAQRIGETGTYEGHIPTFVGFPTNLDQKFVIFTYVENPTEEGYYGNQVAAPLYREITKQILYKFQLNKVSEIKIAKNQGVKADYLPMKNSATLRKIGEMPSMKNLDRKSVLHLFPEFKDKIVFRGHGVVVSQFPPEGAVIEKNQRIFLNLAMQSYE